MGRRQQQASPRAIVIAERRLQAVQLRVAGFTYREIGEALNVSHVQAMNDVKAALAETRAQLTTEARELLALTYERLLFPMRHLAPKVKEGDVQAIEEWRRLNATIAGFLAGIPQQILDGLAPELEDPADDPGAVVIEISATEPIDPEGN